VSFDQQQFLLYLMLLVKKTNSGVKRRQTAWRRDAAVTKLNILNDVGEKHATSAEIEAKIVTMMHM
jgi:hypothetical protein